MDNKKSLYEKISNFKHHHKVLFAIIIGLAVVSFWRGTWGLMDIYILPTGEETSYWISTFLGIIILYATHYIVKELM